MNSLWFTNITPGNQHQAAQSSSGSEAGSEEEPTHVIVATTPNLANLPAIKTSRQSHNSITSHNSLGATQSAASNHSSDKAMSITSNRKSASCLVMHMGGLILKTLPSRPPLPIKSPMSFMRSKAWMVSSFAGAYKRTGLSEL